MADSKSRYSTNAAKASLMAKKSTAMAKKQHGSDIRVNKYRSGWATVDINEIVDKYAPGSKPYVNGGKIIYHNNDGNYSVVADSFHGYLRIQNAKTKKYLDIDGIESTKQEKTHFNFQGKRRRNK